MNHTRASALLCVLLVLLLSACDLSSLPWTTQNGQATIHWKRTSDSPVVVRVVVDPSAAALQTHISDVMRDLNARAINVSMVQAERVPSPYIKVVGKPMNGGSFSLSYDSQGHMLGGVVYVDNSGDVNTVSRKNAVCHELTGHGLGLAHGNVPGPCQNGRLTDWDVALIDAIHDHKDAA